MKDLTCDIHESLITALQHIDRNGKRVVFATDDNKFVGVVTDGDIRRHILAGKSLSSSLGDFVKGKKSFSAKYGSEYSEIVKSIPPSIKIFPLLNEQQEIVDYIEVDKEFHAPIASTELTGNELAYVIECVTSNWISSQGRFVEDFEMKFAEYVGIEFGVSVANGSVALHLALVSLGLGPGDEVIVPNLTFAATINAVLHVGAIPVIVDIELDTWCIDPEMVRKAITSRTKAIIPVHLYGYPCDMKSIMDISVENDLYVIEDCAQAHGAEFEEQKVGSFGHINCFSFFANKIITTGEGGMCLTNDPELDKRMRVLRDHGMRPGRRYWHDVVGYNYRMSNLQAAIGVAQIERIDQILEKREKIREWYHYGLTNCNFLKSQKFSRDRKSVNWLTSFVIDDEKIDREEMIYLAQERSLVIRPFFHALNTMPIYAKYSSPPLLHSINIAKFGLSFPTLIGMNKENYDYICRQIKDMSDYLK